jgi:hypothetical protein
MTTMLLERPDELVHLDDELPSSIADTCASYNAWVAANPGSGH